MGKISTDRYEGKGELRIIHLTDEVFHKTLSDSEALEPQINALTRAARSVTNLGLPLSDRLVAIAIISSLPPSMSTLRTVLSTTSSPTAAYVLSQVILDEQRRVRESGMGATAFFAKAVKKGKGKDKKSEDKSKKYCSHCKICGHDVSECRKLKKEQEAKGGASNSPSSKPTASAKVASTDSTTADTTVQLFTAHIIDPPNSEESAHAFRAHSTPNLQNQCLLDSGASCTMSSHRSWFHSFTPLPTPIRVILGDDSSIDATRTGQIHVHMKANGQWHPAILRDVLFVPDLHGNLLSVTHLTHCGAHIQFSGQACHISDQRGDRTCDGHLQGNLYLMEIRTVVPESANIAHIDHFPAEGDALPVKDEHALVAHGTASSTDIDTWHH